MMQIVASNDPVDVAWAAFDTAALRLHRLYATPTITSSSRASRMEAAQEVARLWDEWRKLFLGEDDEPRPAA